MADGANLYLVCNGVGRNLDTLSHTVTVSGVA